MIIQKEENVEIVEEEKPEQAEFTQVKEKQSNKKVFAYIISFILILIAILALVFAGFTFYNYKNNNVIAKGIYVYGIDVSMLSKEEAKKKIEPKFDEISKTDIELINEDYKTYINPSEIELKYDIDSAINYAYNVGKSGNIFSSNYAVFETLLKGLNITPTYSVNEEALNNCLNNLSKDLPNAVVESNYYTEDSKLIIAKGTDGYIVNVEQTSIDLKNSLNNFSYLTSPVPLTLTAQKAKEINLDEIYKEIHKEPEDAYYTKNPYTVHPSKNGVDFAISLDEAKKLLASSDKEIEIKLKTTYPKVTTSMIGTEAFPDLLGSFSTKFNAGYTARVTNLKLAAKKVNGTVLLPGETFSYNGVVGQRTVAAGYKEAPIYLNGKEVNGLGGGICQISTTLFNAALYSNLGMVEVHNHQFVPGYSSTGRDATVSWGTKDFKFKNTRSYPVRITCTVSGGTAKVNIYGLKEQNEPEVDIYVTINSKTAKYTKSTTYRRLKQNGKTISTEKIYTCTYKPH